MNISISIYFSALECNSIHFASTDHVLSINQNLRKVGGAAQYTCEEGFISLTGSYNRICESHYESETMMYTAEWTEEILCVGQLIYQIDTHTPEAPKGGVYIPQLLRGG